MHRRLLIIALLFQAGTALACEEVVSLAGADWRAHRGDDLAWAQPGFDDSHWSRLDQDPITKLGEMGGLEDGFLWYRLRFQIKPEDLNQACFLYLGQIQETDVTYLNGVRIGGEGRLGNDWYEFVSAMRKPRSYLLPAALLTPGENLVAVRALSLFLPTGLPVEDTKLGPAPLILQEAHEQQRNVERIEVITLTLLLLGTLMAGFLLLTRIEEQQYWVFFSLVVSAATIYYVDSLLSYSLRLDAAWVKRLVFVAGPVIPMASLRYLSLITGQRFPRIYWWMALLPVLCALPLMFDQPIEQVVLVYDLWFVSFAPIALLLLVYLVRGARYQVQQSRPMLFALLAICVGLVYGLLGDGTITGDFNPVELGILGMTAILMLAFARRVTLQHKARLRLSVGVLSAQDDERRRIARELHDGLGQRLVAARLLLEAEALKNPGGQLQEVVRELRDTTQELRAIVYGLRPVELGEVSLKSALHSYSQRVHELTGVYVKVFYSHEGGLPAQVEEHLFRIVQEAVNNATRHGGAREVRVELTSVNRQLTMRITDDGSGFDLDENSDRGLGLTAMAERVRLCDGRFHIESRVGGGTTLRLEIPLS